MLSLNRRLNDSLSVDSSSVGALEAERRSVLWLLKFPTQPTVTLALITALVFIFPHCFYALFTELS